MAMQAATRQLAERLRRVRLELYGVNGAPELAHELGIPTRSWLNYEQGITIPGPILLAFLAQTGVSAEWLADGRP
jgi:hypothetical protein